MYRLISDPQLALDCMSMRSFGQDLFDRTSSVRSIQEVEDADYVASLNFPEEQTALNNEDADQPVRKPGKVRTSKRDRKFSMSKQERHVRKSHDHMHGKRRKPSAKNMRRWEDCTAQMGRAQVMWHESCTGEIVPVPVDRKYHEKRYLPAPDTNNMTAAIIAACKTVTAEDVNAAKDTVFHVIDQAHEFGSFYFWQAEDDLRFFLNDADEQCDLRTVCALLAVIELSVFYEQFDGDVSMHMPATRDCLDALNRHGRHFAERYNSSETGFDVKWWTPDN